jgi:hypothetical protein
MLTDLYLAGHIEDRAGNPHRYGGARLDDPVLSAVLDQVGSRGERGWADLITWNARNAPRDVREQLKAEGWLRRPRVLGVATVRWAPCDEGMIDDLAERVTRALDNAIAGLPAEPRPLALGLLGVLGQMPAVMSFEDAARQREPLREITFDAIEPIMFLHDAIENYHSELRCRLSDPGAV